MSSRLPPLVLAVLATVATACGDGRAGDGAEPRGGVRLSVDLAPAAGGDVPGLPDGCVVDRGARVVRYRVRRGDTLGGIAHRIYGDAALWREIARANSDVVGADGSIRVGDELVIPFEGR